MQHWIVITIGVTAVHFRVADENSDNAFSGSEPIGPLNDPKEAARAATRASMAASMYASAHGEIVGYELLG